MESCHQKENVHRQIPATGPDSGEDLLEECRDLVHHLSWKTESLYRDCRHDRNKAMQIRTMGSALAALAVLVNRLGENLRTTQPAQMPKDARGVTYHSVRSCDFDRLCEK